MAEHLKLAADQLHQQIAEKQLVVVVVQHFVVL
jgi:hypothetical protein